MADKISVNTAELQQCASKYNSALSTLKEAYAAYTRALNDLQSDWTGRAFAAMSGKVLLMTKNLSTSFGKLTDAVSELNEVASITEEAEGDVMSKAKGLEIGSNSPFSEG